MAKQVCTGALMTCSKGTAPCSLVATHALLQVNAGNIGTTAATIMDYKPVVNISTFGMCTTTTNPAVSAATSAASGVLTPMPCVPNTVTPWSPGSATVKIGNVKALNDSSKCKCLWTGEISITNPGQSTVDIP